MSKKFIFIDTDGVEEESPGAYEITDHINVSAGAGDAGKPIVLDAGGKIDDTMIDVSAIDHGALSGLGDDDHTIYTKADGTRAFTGAQSMGGFKLTSLAVGTVGTDAVNLSQLQSVQAGFQLKASCRVATNAALASYTPSGSGVGKTITMDSVGILTIDGINTVLGDRILIKDEAASHVDHGIYEVTTEGTAGVAAILTRAEDVDDSPTNEVESGMLTFIQEGTVNNKTGWSLITADPITVDTTALQFTQFQGLPQYTASLGVELVGVDFRADLLASGGLKLTGNEIGIEPNDFAGAGLIDDGADNMAIDWSTAFNDAKAVKAEDLNSTTNGEGASIIGVEDAAAVFAGGDVEAVLLELYGLASEGTGEEATVGAGGVTAGDLLYFSANDTVLPMPINSVHRCVGIALTTEIATATVKYIRWDEVVEGVLSGATAGSRYYWNGSALVTTIPSGSGNYVWAAGIAKNATDLLATVEFVKKNS